MALADCLKIARRMTMLLMIIYLIILFSELTSKYSTFVRNHRGYGIKFLFRLGIVLIGLYGSYSNKSTYLFFFLAPLILLTMFEYDPDKMNEVEFIGLILISTLIQSELIRRSP